MISVKPFDERYLPDASQIFAAKYRILCQKNHLLPPEFQNETLIQPKLKKNISENPFAHYLKGPPIFLNLSLDEDSLEEARINFLGPGKQAFIARSGGDLIACLRGQRDMGPGCELFDVEGSLGIDFAYTRPAFRGSGVAARLLDALLRWGQAQGMGRCVVDFESANRLARRFWLRHFQPICYSVIRRVDERV